MLFVMFWSLFVSVLSVVMHTAPMHIVLMAKTQAFFDQAILK